MTAATDWKVTGTGQVIRGPKAAQRFPDQRPTKRSRVCDIVDRRPGMCAAVVRSEGLVHYCCGARVPPGQEINWCFCEDHDPRVALEVKGERWARHLRRYYEKETEKR
jgi:hypothetical protein